MTARESEGGHVEFLVGGLLFYTLYFIIWDEKVVKK
jgi:hypothetical protein